MHNPYQHIGGAYKRMVVDYIDTLAAQGMTDMFRNATPILMRKFGLSEEMAKNWISDWCGVCYFRNQNAADAAAASH